MNPLASFGRSWRRFGRRTFGMKLRSLAIIFAVIVGLGIWVGTSPNKVVSVVQGNLGYTPVTEASTSSRGVTSNSINVVFPVVSLTSLAGQEGFAFDPEFADQTKAINLYVNQINQNGGINGRKINPIITPFDPTNNAYMRSLCKTWTQGTPAAFAVVDGIGAWQGSNELCITQEGHTPFIGEWTTVTNWTNLGSPYLWWLGPNDAAILKTVVSWGKSTGLLGGSRKVGIIAGNRASDDLALNNYLLPDLKKIGVTPMVASIEANPSATAATTTQAQLAIERFKAAGIQSVIPLVPENVFFAMLGAETSQKYFPRLLLSDYESEIQIGLGLIPIPYEQALNGQEGVTTLTLGGIDDPRPQSQGGYDPGVRSCWNTWHKKYPQNWPGSTSDYLEEQGPIVAWCQAIKLFATAAEKAGRNLNRRTFVEAMASIKNFAGTYSPILSYGPDKFYGPVEYRVVRIHNNVPPSKACILLANHKPVGTCWQIVDNWRPLPTP